MLCVVWLLVDCPWKPLCFFRDVPLFILCCKIVPNLNILRCSIEFGSSLHRLWYDFAMDPLRTKIVVTYTCFWFRSFTKKPLVLLLTHNWPITDLLLTPKFPEGGNKENANLVKSTWQKRTQGYFNFPSGNRKTRGKIQNNPLFYLHVPLCPST